MGNGRSAENLIIPQNAERKVFIAFEGTRQWAAHSYHGSYASFIFLIKYQRYRWTISKRYSDIAYLDRELYGEYTDKIDRIHVPRKYWKLLKSHDNELLAQRGRDIVAYLQRLCDDEEIFASRVLKDFLGIGEVILDPLSHL